MSPKSSALEIFSHCTSFACHVCKITLTAELHHYNYHSYLEIKMFSDPIFYLILSTSPPKSSNAYKAIQQQLFCIPSVVLAAFSWITELVVETLFLKQSVIRPKKTRSLSMFVLLAFWLRLITNIDGVAHETWFQQAIHYYFPRNLWELECYLCPLHQCQNARCFITRLPSIPFCTNVLLWSIWSDR